MYSRAARSAESIVFVAARSIQTHNKTHFKYRYYSIDIYSQYSLKNNILNLFFVCAARQVVSVSINTDLFIIYYLHTLASCNVRAHVGIYISEQRFEKQQKKQPGNFLFYLRDWLSCLY